ncbi:MAG: Xylose ABC transporter, permease protein XylH, partial [uncultured Solirubrobacteraceae bacterium]
EHRDGSPAHAGGAARAARHRRLRARAADQPAPGRARLAADHRRPDRHRDHLPDAERPLPHRGQLRQPHRAVRRDHHDRDGRRLGAAARRDRPVDRLRLRRGGRAHRAAPDAGRQRAAHGRGHPRRDRRGRRDRHAARPHHHPDRDPLVRGDAGRPARVERRGAAPDRLARHRDPAGRVHHRPGQRVPLRRRRVAARARLRGRVRRLAAQRDPRAAQGRPGPRARVPRRPADRRAGARARRRRLCRQPGPRAAVRLPARGRAAAVLDLRPPAHALRPEGLRRRRQRRGGAPRGHRRQPDPGGGVRDLLLDGGDRRDHPRLAPALGGHERRRRLDPPVLHRGGRDRRHVAVRRPRDDQERAARGARHRVHRQRARPPGPGLGREVRHHGRRAAARGHGGLPVAARPGAVGTRV